MAELRFHEICAVLRITGEQWQVQRGDRRHRLVDLVRHTAGRPQVQRRSRGQRSSPHPRPNAERPAVLCRLMTSSHPMVLAGDVP